MSLPKLAFEVWPEFPFISQRLAIRDFSRLSCQRVTCTPVQSISAMNMARRSPLRRGQAMLERRLLWIREFESSHPSQPVRSLLCDFRLCKYCRFCARECGAGCRPGGALQGATRGLLAMGRAPDTTHHTRRVMPDFTSKMLNGFPPGGNAGCFDGRAQI